MSSVGCSVIDGQVSNSDIYCVAEDVCLGFEKTVYTTIEEIGYILVCVKVLCPEDIQREVFVNVSTDGLTASEPILILLKYCLMLYAIVLPVYPWTGL